MRSFSISRFVRSYRVIGARDKHEPSYDGMPKLWFDDVETLLAARQSPEWKASSKDEVNFIDHSRVVYFVSEEHTILSEAMR